MRIVEKASKSFVLAAVLMLAFVPVVDAATSTPAAPVAAVVSTSADPDPAANPILAPLLKVGAKAYFLGNRSGMDGWFVIKDNRAQTLYITADKQTVLIGMMFGANGENISGAQAKDMLSKNKELSATLEALSKSGTGASSDALPAPVANAAVASATPTTAISPGEKLMQDLTKATGVNVGYVSAPLLLMVMDTNCPHCQATWRALRVPVFKNALRVRLIPIAAQGADSERSAAQLLQATDPLDSWDKYVAGDKTQLAGNSGKDLIPAIQSNHDVIDSWGIHSTPYMVYRAKDGKVKIVEGEPDKVDAILSDIAP